MEHSSLLLIRLMELFMPLGNDGQWELIKEKATIDTDTHQNKSVNYPNCWKSNG